jgi:FG-GAP-like repeat
MAAGASSSGLSSNDFVGLPTSAGGPTSDFNGDGDADILWQNANGQAAIWLMNGTTPISQPAVGASPGSSWHIVGAGDFNGDGKSDILWQNTSGQAAIWLMNGTTPISEPLVGANPGPSWHIVGTGDFNGAGDADILWQNTDGQAWHIHAAS